MFQNFFLLNCNDKNRDIYCSFQLNIDQTDFILVTNENDVTYKVIGVKQVLLYGKNKKTPLLQFLIGLYMPIFQYKK